MVSSRFRDLFRTVGMGRPHRLGGRSNAWVDLKGGGWFRTYARSRIPSWPLASGANLKNASGEWFAVPAGEGPAGITSRYNRALRGRRSARVRNSPPRSRDCDAREGPDRNRSVVWPSVSSRSDRLLPVARFVLGWDRQTIDLQARRHPAWQSAPGSS